MSSKQKYPTQRYVKFTKIVMEKVDAGYYHIPDAIRSPEDAYDTIIETTKCHEETQEVLGALFLNTKNKVVGMEIIHKGSINASVCSVRDIMKSALMHNATSIMVFHNHPSGDPTPSREDIEVTKKLMEAGSFMDLTVLDHIVIGDPEADYTRMRYRSIKEEGAF